MNVRGWLLVGSVPGLPQERYRGIWSVVPNAVDHVPGDWVMLMLNGMVAVAVCVEMPIA